MENQENNHKEKLASLFLLILKDMKQFLENLNLTDEQIPIFVIYLIHNGYFFTKKN